MKTQLLRISVLAAIAVAAVFAQDAHAVRVNIPFGFTAANHQFPAGRYHLALIGQNAVVIQSEAGPVAIVQTMATVSRKTYGMPHLLFYQYGDAVFLSEVWFPEGGAGRKPLPGRQELRLRAGSVAPSSVVLAALR